MANHDAADSADALAPKTGLTTNGVTAARPGEPIGPTSATAGVGTRNAVIFDVVAVMVFALLARIAHNSEDLPLSFSGWLDTTWPFLIGIALVWGLIASGRLHRAPGSAWVICAATWVVGMLFWAVRHSEIPHWSFMIVAAVMLIVVLIGWRFIATRVHTLMTSRAQRNH